MKLYILLYIILLAGCTRYVPVPGQCPAPTACENTTITEFVNNTIYINVTNATACQEDIPLQNHTNTSYIVSLIQRLKRCEARNTHNWNLSECEDNVERLNNTIGKLNDTLTTIREAME